MKYLYQEIAGKVELDILNKSYMPGEKLLPERQLAQKYQTTQLTVSKALSVLADKGLITRLKGVGNFVNSIHKLKKISQTGAEGKLLKVGIIYAWKNQNGYYSNAILNGIERALNEYSSGSIFLSAFSGYENYLTILNREQLDSLILLSPPDNKKMEIKALEEDKIPFVVVGGSWEEFPEWPCFDSDAKKTGQLLAQELLNAGYEHIGIVTRATQLSNNRERLRSFLDSLAKQQIIIKPDNLIMKPEDNDLKEDISTLLNSKDRPEAIFAGNFNIAEDIYSLAKKMNIKIPSQLDIVSCDMEGEGLLLNEYPLTTVVQPLTQMGYDAAAFLFQELKGTKEENFHFERYDVQLINNSILNYPVSYK